MSQDHHVGYADSISPIRTTDVKQVSEEDFVPWDEHKSRNLEFVDTINPGTQSGELYGTDIFLTNPEDVDELPKEWHLHQLLRAANRDKLNEWKERSAKEESQIEHSI